jgi:hypothetical protein
LISLLLVAVAQPACKLLFQQITKRFVRLKALVVVVLRRFSPQHLKKARKEEIRV